MFDLTTSFGLLCRAFLNMQKMTSLLQVNHMLDTIFLFSQHRSIVLYFELVSWNKTNILKEFRICCFMLIFVFMIMICV
ncbi:hypothetical protein PHAVU_007G246100 [Phaseolus vulgaris]|uniref:Uncharacterized protein n=1 Tax=Phaseolus vulgaris TaxID=3885 RepID=V7BI26_PHAVU|nr:hypothetical protein PHAVU_007G246100g [Phaseolus vulgaris]ESW17522.1 hypothetical protein PHAVU_007G246100g [Phaseolus vulgaris]